jgi:vacuolar-type H+-ATPase subunit H
MELMRIFSEDGPMEDKFDSLWRHLMVYKSFADSDLSEAKIRRAEADAARERAEMETLRATELACERMRSDAEKHLLELRSKVEEERVWIVAGAQRQAEEILEEARATAQQEAKVLRRQASEEVKAILTGVGNMRAAIDEELGTQRILAYVSKLKADSRRMLAESDHNYGDESLASEGQADLSQVERMVNGGPDHAVDQRVVNSGPDHTVAQGVVNGGPDQAVAQSAVNGGPGDAAAQTTSNGGPAAPKRSRRTRTPRASGAKKSGKS